MRQEFRAAGEKYVLSENELWSIFFDVLKESDENMNLPNTTKRAVKPMHPGEMLREDFLPDCGLSATRLAEALGVSRQTINELLRERRAVSPEMAVRLARLFGNTPEFWLNAQRALDLWEAERKLRGIVGYIQPLLEKLGKGTVPIWHST